MYSRCPNDVFGYCSKEPDFDVTPYEASIKGRTEWFAPHSTEAIVG